MRFAAFLLLLSTPSTYALIKGMSLVHAAPVFRKASENAQVIQYLHLGEELTLSPNQFFNGTQKFYETFDRSGKKAFLLSRHIQVLTFDTRELGIPIPRPKNDETDERLPEPLGNFYPLSSPPKTPRLRF